MGKEQGSPRKLEMLRQWVAPEKKMAQGEPKTLGNQIPLDEQGCPRGQKIPGEVLVAAPLACNLFHAHKVANNICYFYHAIVVIPLLSVHLCFLPAMAAATALLICSFLFLETIVSLSHSMRANS